MNKITVKTPNSNNWCLVDFIDRGGMHTAQSG